MKTIVFAYGAFGCVGLRALLAAGFSVVQVVTHADEDPAAGASVRAFCEEHAIAVSCAVDVAQIRRLAPDFIFSFYWRALLPKAVLDCASRGAFNLHGSLLPRYRGRAPLNWVLVRGETETGVTLHHMVEKADAGDIVAQAGVVIDYADTAATLQRKLLVAAEGLLARVLPLIAQGTAPRIPQDLSQGFYCGRRRPEDGRIDWREPAEGVRNLVRAVTRPFPGAFTCLGPETLLVWEVRVVEGSGLPGEVLSQMPLVVACGEQALAIVSGEVAGVCFSGMELAARLGLREGDMLA